MQQCVNKELALVVALSLLFSSLGGCGASNRAAGHVDPYASLPYADAATFAVTREELSAALFRVLQNHGYVATITDSSQGIIRGELRSNRLLPPEEQFTSTGGSGVLGTLTTFLGIVLLIPLIATLIAHPSSENSVADESGSTSETSVTSYHYLLTAAIARTGSEVSDLSLSLELLEYHDDEVLDSAPIENKAFNYALFDALKEELNRTTK